MLFFIKGFKFTSKTEIENNDVKFTYLFPEPSKPSLYYEAENKNNDDYDTFDINNENEIDIEDEDDSVNNNEDDINHEINNDDQNNEPNKLPTMLNNIKMYVINPDLPKICIIVDDFGNTSTSLFNKFNELDSNVAFAILPGNRNSKVYMHKAIDNGHEVLIHVPLEPEDSTEPQETNTILTTMLSNEITQQVNSWINELPLAVGMNNHQGSLATRDAVTMSSIFSALSGKNLYFIDSLTTEQSVVSDVANRFSIPTAVRDIFLDTPDSSLTTAKNKLDQIKKMRNKKFIVVITHSHSEIKERQLMHFIKRLKDAGYELVPPSKIVF
jgi:polysaccharide deacetylase 2 family uncharacterized protein YibQ